MKHPKAPWVVRLKDKCSYNPKLVGAKFARLSRASAMFRVPPAICISTELFREVVRSTPALEQELRFFFDTVRQTCGQNWNQYVTRLKSSLQHLRLPEGFIHALSKAKGELSLDSAGGLIARSSAVEEDGPHHTYAGIYESFGPTREDYSLLKAILDCWQSYYSEKALWYRIRAGDFELMPRLAVIIQKWIDGNASGIAMSQRPLQAIQHSNYTKGGVLIEWVDGSCAPLTSGEATSAQRLFVTRDLQTRDAAFLTLAGPSSQGSSPAVEQKGANDIDDSLSNAFDILSVAEMVFRLETFFDMPVYVEWTSDKSGVALLQIRPLPDSPHSHIEATGSIFRWAPLYEPSLMQALDLRDCAGIAAHWISKRGPIRQRARSAGIRAGGAVAVECNIDGIKQGGLAALDELQIVSSPELILDLGQSLRQLIVQREEIESRLCDLLSGRGARAGLPHTLLVREFVRGQMGVVSTAAGPGCNILVELNTDGLESLTRGLGDCLSLYLNEVGEPLGPPMPSLTLAKFLSVPVEQRAQLVHFTYEESCRARERGLGEQVCLEWVIAEDNLIFVDHSYERTPLPAIGTCLSMGTAIGQAKIAPDSDFLRQLSQSAAISVNSVPGGAEGTEEYLQGWATSLHCEDGSMPIVVARHPYSALALLIGRAAGFIFESGPMLCHLALLLREAHIPAGVVPELFSCIRENDLLIISDGNASRIE